MQQSEPTGHTEDGVLFCVTFAKYSDGSVCVDSADVNLIPTWVNMHANSGATEYNILPLEESTTAQWQAQFGLTDTQLANAKASFDRTQRLTLDGHGKGAELSGPAEAASRKSPPGQCRITKEKTNAKTTEKYPGLCPGCCAHHPRCGAAHCQCSRDLPASSGLTSGTGPAVQPTEATTEATAPTEEETEPPTTTMPEPDAMWSPPPPFSPPAIWSCDRARL